VGDPADPVESTDSVDSVDLNGATAADRADGRGDWPDGLISARSALERGLPGWPKAGEKPPGPPIPVPLGRGGEQRLPRPYNARPGGPPPWAGLPADRRRPCVADVRAALDGVGAAVRSPRENVPLVNRASAVLAPLYDEDGLAHVILTRRTWGLRTHQGEVSFPGGRVDPGEQPVAAARREAEEEIDLDPASVEVIGELDHLSTVSSASFIVPFVGVVPGRPDLRPNPDEVDAVLHVPLAELADPAIFREEIWTFPNGQDRSIFFFELVGDTVWGMTAALLRQLLGIVTKTLGRGDLAHP
jgi:8-oxo-dGTP pyrophosphatase MutT (NUDIX family)